MKNLIKTALATAGLSLAVVSFGTDVLGQTRRPALRTAKRPAAQTGQSVAQGTRIRVRMNETLNSKTANVGDRFTVTVREPVYSTRGAVVIPVGSELIGRVDKVQKAVKGGKVGEMDVSFVQVKLPNGVERAINGSLTELVADDAKSDAEGTARGDKMKHRKVIFIGGGGAGGAVLGAAIGGGKGALIGGLIGAGAGLLGERLTKGEDAEVESGTEFGVYLNRAVTLPVYAAEADPEEFPEEAPSGSRTYVVQVGDTLGTISRMFYGTSARYMDIYEANRHQLSGPNSITVGQTLIIP
ncbi:MAG: LysM peptidoglycan-binding domain-containing protein [Acidobacteria bacterium]|nr:LysM peptidoglycan-binding domain-containing protein [Acidobacteriota bacterium]